MRRIMRNWMKKGCLTLLTAACILAVGMEDITDCLHIERELDGQNIILPLQVLHDFIALNHIAPGTQLQGICHQLRIAPVKPQLTRRHHHFRAAPCDQGS